MLLFRYFFLGRDHTINFKCNDHLKNGLRKKAIDLNLIFRIHRFSVFYYVVNNIVTTGRDTGFIMDKTANKIYLLFARKIAHVFLSNHVQSNNDYKVVCIIHTRIRRCGF